MNESMRHLGKKVWIHASYSNSSRKDVNKFNPIHTFTAQSCFTFRSPQLSKWSASNNYGYNNAGKPFDPRLKQFMQIMSSCRISKRRIIRATSLYIWSRNIMFLGNHAQEMGSFSAVSVGTTGCEWVLCSIHQPLQVTLQKLRYWYSVVSNLLLAPHMGSRWDLQGLMSCEQVQTLSGFPSSEPCMYNIAVL